MDDFDDFNEIDEIEVPDEAVEELDAPGVGILAEIDATQDTIAPGISDISQAWQDNNLQNMMNNYGLEAALHELNIEYNPADINGILSRYSEQNGSYGLTEPQFYEVIDELRGANGGGRKRKGRKTRRDKKKSKKGRKTRKGRKGKKTRKGRKGKKSRKTRK
jgi:hypothetical protein